MTNAEIDQQHNLVSQVDSETPPDSDHPVSDNVDTSVEEAGQKHYTFALILLLLVQFLGMGIAM